MFEINRKYSPLARQSEAIEELSKSRRPRETLLGATGVGKTFIMASVASRIKKPTLVLAPNKTLAAQLYSEFSELLPETHVEYFVSYYDYYQPEAYVVAQDLFIEKDASINEEIDRLRHSATNALLQSKNVLVVASVSCIYGIGDPEKYRSLALQLRVGDTYPRSSLQRSLAGMLYTRNDAVLERSGFRIQGEQVEIWPADKKFALRMNFWGDELEKIEAFHPTTGKEYGPEQSFFLLPASHYAIPKDAIERACFEIEAELEERLDDLYTQGKALEADRLEKRVSYDTEMLREQGFVSGIENYSRIFDKRAAGEPPHTLLDYFPDDFLCFIDESHIGVPQLGGMYSGDKSRKQTLIDHGFRLPSALDNRPLTLDEFLQKTPKIICVSATPGEWEKRNAPKTTEQVIRPTGILDPKIEVRKKKDQLADLLSEIRTREAKDERVLVTTLTKKMSEELSEYLLERGVKVKYLHSDVDTLERIEIIKELRLGKITALVGVNLLREGLDLPEVSLVAILDADRDGFLRNETSLIQTIGRAARHKEGLAILYADKNSKSMDGAIEETRRRRKIQKEYNAKHNIVPSSINKKVGPTLKKAEKTKRKPKKDIKEEIIDLEEEMLLAAEELRFEEAALLRDELDLLREKL